jgi:tetratricopeptide (TPR) repeat protein
MTNTRKLQLALIGGSMLLFVALLFADTTPRALKKEAAEAARPAASMDIDTYINEEKSGLDQNITEKAASIEEKINASEGAGKSAWYDSIIALYDGHVKPAIAAYYTEQKNNIAPSFDGWIKTGSRYYRAVGFVNPEIQPTLYSKAIHAYEKAVALQPGNLEAKTSLAVCYVEGSSNPMQGITMLREVLTVDSNNVNALLSLGMFAVKSGQHEKAIERFTKIIAIDTTYIEAYLYLADSYEKLKNTPAAIESLKKYEQKVDDVSIKAEVRNYINKLSQRGS